MSASNDKQNGFSDALKAPDPRQNRLPKRHLTSEVSKPLFSAADIQKQLKTYDRSPFMSVLALWLECMPSADAIAEFAERYPDKYVASMANLAKIAGFTEKTEIAVDINVSVRTMSDSQLEDEARKLVERFKETDPTQSSSELNKEITDAEVIDITPTDAPAPNSTDNNR